MVLALAGMLLGERTAGASDRELIWHDEFTSDGAPDPTKWSFDVGRGPPPGWGNNELQTYTADTANAFRRDGVLVIRAIQSQTGHTSARLKSKFIFKYGTFVARVKIPYAQGIWPAVWLIGSEHPDRAWPYCGEIDVMENFGHANNDSQRSHGAVHGPGYSGGQSLSFTFHLNEGESLSDDFHDFAIQWRPDELRFLVDDQVYGSISPDDLPAGSDWVFNKPFRIILNVAVGGSPAPVGYPDETTSFPQEMLIDFVRVYQSPGVRSEDAR